MRLAYGSCAWVIKYSDPVLSERSDIVKKRPVLETSQVARVRIELATPRFSVPGADLGGARMAWRNATLRRFPPPSGPSLSLGLGGSV
jgi:hypothetical protein